MGFFRSLVMPTVAQSAPPPRRKFSFEGLSDRETAALHTAAAIRACRGGETLFQSVENRSFLIVVEGAVDVTVQAGQGRTLAVTYFTGDCISPCQGSSHLRYAAQCREASTVVEITPAAFRLLPDKVQFWIHQRANRSLGRAQRDVVREGLETERRNNLLTLFIENEFAKNRSVVYSDFVQSFIQKTPRLPVFAMELAAKLLDERTTVQEVVASIKRDPAVAAAVMRTVNSAMFGFVHKIENFYHACVVLGFDNIYQLVLRDALRQVVPSNAETRMVHTHSCVISALCYETAMAAGGKVHPQTAMTYGLLHEIGCSVIWLMKAEKSAPPDLLSLLDTAKIGAELLHHWGLPDRISRVVESQRYPDFAPPDAVDSEFRQDLAVLHLAHLFERLLSGDDPDPAARVHSPAWMGLISKADQTPEDFFKAHIAPALCRNKQRYGEEVRIAIEQFEETSKPVE